MLVAAVLRTRAQMKTCCIKGAVTTGKMEENRIYWWCSYCSVRLWVSQFLVRASTYLQSTQEARETTYSQE